MLAKVNGPKDFAAGLIYVAMGFGLFFWSQSYEIGTAVRMGPGYFPLGLALVLLGMGLCLVVKGLLTGEKPVGAFASQQNDGARKA